MNFGFSANCLICTDINTFTFTVCFDIDNKHLSNKSAFLALKFIGINTQICIFNSDRRCSVVYFKKIILHRCARLVRSRSRRLCAQPTASLCTTALLTLSFNIFYSLQKIKIIIRESEQSSCAKRSRGLSAQPSRPRTRRVR